MDPISKVDEGNLPLNILEQGKAKYLTFFITNIQSNISRSSQITQAQLLCFFGAKELLNKCYIEGAKMQRDFTGRAGLSVNFFQIIIRELYPKNLEQMKVSANIIRLISQTENHEIAYLFRNILLQAYVIPVRSCLPNIFVEIICELISNIQRGLSAKFFEISLTCYLRTFYFI